jgi:hypothetical protein
VAMTSHHDPRRAPRKGPTYHDRFVTWAAGRLERMAQSLRASISIREVADGCNIPAKPLPRAVRQSEGERMDPRLNEVAHVD